MLFERRLRAGLADGTITVAFRRWARPQVVAGGTYRTGGGPLVRAEQVDVVTVDQLTADDARQAGYDSVPELVAALRGEAGLPLYRIRFRPSQAPDPRDVLSDATDLDDGELAAIDARLARLDQAAGETGPWTHAVLTLIAERPAVSATQLAPLVGLERLVFKRRVRALKELGLTISLPTGYRISPRGQAYRSRR